MNEVAQVIIAGMVSVAGLAAAYLLTVIAGYWVKKKRELAAIIDENDQAANIPFLNYLYKKLLDTVDKVVAALNSTMKKEILDATSDGKLTKEDGKKIRDKALELVNAEIPAIVKDNLSLIIGDFNETVKTLIENAVENAKAEDEEEEYDPELGEGEFVEDYEDEE